MMDYVEKTPLLHREAGEVGRAAGRRGCRASARLRTLASISIISLPASRTRRTPSDLLACFAVSPATSPAIAVEEVFLQGAY